jgi:diguanylate cyclase (GGDEF)-like protein
MINSLLSIINIPIESLFNLNPKEYSKEKNLVLSLKVKLLISILTIISLVVSGFFFLRLLNHDYIGTSLDLIIFISNYFVISNLKKTPKYYDRLSQLSLTLALLVIFMNLYLDHNIIRGIIWSYIFIIFSFSLRDRIEGLYWSSILFTMSSIVIFSKDLIGILTIMEYVTIFSSMVIIISIMFFYENMKFEATEKFVHIKDINFLKSIMDFQENIILIADTNNKVIHSNKQFLDFFCIKNEEEYNKNYNCISENFIDLKYYYSNSCGDSNWIKEVYQSQEHKKVLMLNLDFAEPRAFKMSINYLKDYSYYVLTFTDITLIEEEARIFEYNATHDHLTSLYNRNMFSNLYNKEKSKINNENKNEENGYLILMDIDKFKTINDDFGHLVGDEVLVKLAKNIKAWLEKDDILFGRWGGEEFLFYGKFNSKEECIDFFNHIRLKISKLLFNNSQNTFTCSFGITTNDFNVPLNTLLETTDKALYKAKDNGRNRVEFNTSLINSMQRV